jgi:hypothetical protein
VGDGGGGGGGVHRGSEGLYENGDADRQPLRRKLKCLRPNEEGCEEKTGCGVMG